MNINIAQVASLVGELTLRLLEKDNTIAALQKELAEAKAEEPTDLAPAESAA